MSSLHRSFPNAGDGILFWRGDSLRCCLSCLHVCHSSKTVSPEGDIIYPSSTTGGKNGFKHIRTDDHLGYWIKLQVEGITSIISLSMI